MLPLRHSGRWRIASAILLLGVLVAALMPVVWFWDDPLNGLRWFDNVDKWLHGFTFFILAVWFAGMNARNRYLTVVGGLLIFGFLIEGCQYLVTYRSAEWVDIGANAVGILAGMGFALLGAGGWCVRVESYLAENQAS